MRRVPDARLLAAFGWLEVEDIDALWQQLSPESQRRICHLLGISLDPAFVSGGIGKLLKSSMRRLPPGIDAFVAELMAEPLVRDHVELHDSLPTTGEEYIAAVDSLLESWPVGAVRLGACLWAIEEDQAVHLVESHDRVGVHLSVAEEAVRALGAGERLPTPTLEPFDSSESRPAGQGAKNDDVAADSAHQSTPEDEAALFSTLDQILVKNAIATHLDYTGSLTPGDLRRLVLEVTRLSLDRRQSYYFHGLVRSLDPEMPPPKKAAMNDDRWAWYRFGRISGLVRQGAAEDLADQVVKWPDETKDVLGDPRRGASIAAPCVLAVLGRDDRLAAELLDVAGPDFASRTACMHAVYEHARMILAADQPTEAFLLFDSLLGLKQPRRPFPTGVPESWIDLHRRLSACMRARGDFSVAEALIDDVADLSEDDPLDNESRAVLEAERGLICAQLDHLGHLTFPKDPDQRNQVRERVQRGAANLNEALELFVDEVRANYCMGVLAVCEENWQRAEQLLERADRGVRSDPVFDSTGIARAIRFYRGSQFSSPSKSAMTAPLTLTSREQWKTGTRRPTMNSSTSLPDSKHTDRRISATSFSAWLTEQVPPYLQSRFSMRCPEEIDRRSMPPSN
ncbi:MAG: hypothetical protein M5U31_16225 [Acidimicrobiia bacterium]|nr:hypothetical protein [Acidimicrobiia bacterium]